MNLKLILYVVSISLAFALTACGKTEEKVKEVELPVYVPAEPTVVTVAPVDDGSCGKVSGIKIYADGELISIICNDNEGSTPKNVCISGKVTVVLPPKANCKHD